MRGLMTPNQIIPRTLLNRRCKELRENFYNELLPPPELTIYEWADKYRILSSEASSEPGPWRTSRFPYLKEIMYELSPQSGSETVTCMKGAQLGLTELAINTIGYTIHWDPKPILYIQKTVDAVMKFSAQRFSKSLENTPEVYNRLPKKGTTSDNTNTKLLKNFPGGILIMGGANSAASLRSMPIALLILDEEDSYEMDIQEEGDPTILAERRTANFPNRKIFHLSTPKVKETSKIEPLFEEGDQRYFFVPCPFCAHFQTIRWENIIYTDNDPKTAKLKCEGCNELIKEYHKTYMLDNGEWRAMYPGRDSVSFHINSLYSPIGFYSWRDAVKLWLKYRKDNNTEILRTFVNTVLGETYSEAGKMVDYTGLSSHKEIYSAPVPEEVLVLTAGVDVQEDRIECEIVGWGENQKSWSIDYSRYVGDTESNYVWEQLDQHLLKTWRHQTGIDMNLACVAIDSGHRAKIVYKFCLSRFHRRVFPIKGVPGWGKGLINRPINMNQHGVWLYNAYVDEIKSKIYSQLKVEDENVQGYCCFPDRPEYDTSYFKMLTAEKLLRKRVSGQYKLVWELPPGRHNEALDCRGYSIAALNILKPNFEEIKKSGTPLVVKNTTLKRRKRVLSKGVEL